MCAKTDGWEAKAEVITETHVKQVMRGAKGVAAHFTKHNKKV